MKLGKRQNDIVNQLIREEVKNVLTVRDGSAKMYRKADLYERLVEAGPDAMRVDLSIVDKQVEDLVFEAATDLSMRFVYEFHTKVLKVVCDVMNKHAMSAVEMDHRELADEIEDFDPDSLQEISQEAVSDVTDALVKYAREVAKMAVDLAGGNEDEV